MGGIICTHCGGRGVKGYGVVDEQKCSACNGHGIIYTVKFGEIPKPEYNPHDVAFHPGGFIPDDNPVSHPRHYTGLPVRVKDCDGVEITAELECIDLIEALGLSFHLGNAQKYLFRAGRNDRRAKGEILEDLEKARWYLDRHLETLG